MQLRKLSNTRDLGGLPTTDGRSIKYGKLIRSGKLHKIPDSTKKALESLGITRVIDLRIPLECEEGPDTLLEGSEYVNVPVLCTVTPGITHEKAMRIVMRKESKRIKEDFGSADNYMIEMYKTIVFSDESKEKLKQILRYVIDEEGCVIWHCNGGKDRAGIISMLVESLLGVDEDIIIADYVISHNFQKKKYFWSRFGLFVIPLNKNFKAILYALMAAKTKYIVSTLEAIKERYGSVVDYCKEALGVTDEDIAKLKDKYLE